MSCAELTRRIEQIGAAFRRESSVKLEPGRVLDERVLMSLQRPVFGAEPLPGIVGIAREFGAPEAITGQFATALEGAGVVHFGFEGGGGRAIFKVYFEYVAAARAAMQHRPPDHAVVHCAFKWEREYPSRHAVTIYTLRPDANIADLARAMERVAPLPCIRHLLHETVTLALARQPGFQPMALDVAEAGNPRQSIDIKLYPAGLRLEEIAGLVGVAVSALDAPAERWNHVLKSHGDKQLGHVSAGQGRDGKPFATVYFGGQAGGGA